MRDKLKNFIVQIINAQFKLKSLLLYMKKNQQTYLNVLK